MDAAATPRGVAVAVGTSADKTAKSSTTTAAHQHSETFFSKVGSGGFFAPIMRATRPHSSGSAPLHVSKPGDALENEAERTADQVMRTPAPGVTSVAAGPRDTTTLSRSGVGPSSVTGDTHSAIEAAKTGGQPLSTEARQFAEPRFGADFSDIRVHTDDAAAGLSNQLSARAFTHQNHIFFARDQYQPDSSDGRRLLAHELTHTIQQGHAHQGTGLQRAVHVTTSAPTPSVQRLGISDALDYFADKAYHIPGFRMLTLVLGFNPINMKSADRTAANLLRALIELLPGGAIITQVLDTHGVINKAAAWIEAKIAALGDIGSQIIGALKRFINSLGWRDIFDLGDVWDRAKRIFTDPIDRLISFGVGVATELLQIVKEAILRPLAALAEGTRGYDLLKAILGLDPITGDPVPRNAETLIGGFMKLIGQEEVWSNLKKGNAVPRAWAWFQVTLAGLMGFVTSIPVRIVGTLRSLTFQDVISVVGVFRKMVGVIVDSAVEFVSWGGKQVLGLLEILFSVVAPKVMPYVAKAKATFHTIIKDPVRFVGNLVRAGRLGFQMFEKNIVTHLKTALIKWITGPLGEAGVYIPTSFNLIEIVKLVLSVLGLTWQNIRGKLVKIIPEPVLAALEKTAQVLVTLVTQGPAAAWEQIKTELSELKDQLIGQVTQMITSEVVKAAVAKLVTMLNPAGAVVQAIIATYNTVTFFIQKIEQIASVVASFIDSIAAIAAGQVEGAAKRVEQTMANTLTLVVSFLAKFAGLGNIPEKLVGIIKKIRQPIDKGLDKIVGWLGGVLQKLVGAAKAGIAGHRGNIAELRKELLAVEFRERFEVNGENHSVYTKPSAPENLYTASAEKPSQEAVADQGVRDAVANFNAVMKQYRAKISEYANAEDNIVNVKHLKSEAIKLQEKAKVLQVQVVNATRAAMGKSPNQHAPGVGNVAPHELQLRSLRKYEGAHYESWKMESEHLIPRKLISSYFAALPVPNSHAEVLGREYEEMYTVLMYRKASKGKTSTAAIGDNPTTQRVKKETKERMRAILQDLWPESNLASFHQTLTDQFSTLAQSALSRATSEADSEQLNAGTDRGAGAKRRPTDAAFSEAFNKQKAQIDTMFQMRLDIIRAARGN